MYLSAHLVTEEALHNCCTCNSNNNALCTCKKHSVKMMTPNYRHASRVGVSVQVAQTGVGVDKLKKVVEIETGIRSEIQSEQEISREEQVH